MKQVFTNINKYLIVYKLNLYYKLSVRFLPFTLSERAVLGLHYKKMIFKCKCLKNAITFDTTARLSLLYKCSLNFLTGLSSHIEINVVEKKSAVLGAIESTTTEITDRISEKLNEVLSSIPKQRGELLHSTAKRTVIAIDKQKNKDLVFSANYPGIVDLSKDLNEKVVDFEEELRRCYRYAELNLIQQIEDKKQEEQEQLGTRLTDSTELGEPERLQANKHELLCDEV